MAYEIERKFLVRGEFKKYAQKSFRITPDIILYLSDTPTKEELASILEKLGMKASQILRKGEQIFKDNYKGKDFSEDEWLDIMVENPKLIERPIVVKNDKAVLGRPPENVLDLL